MSRKLEVKRNQNNHPPESVNDSEESDHGYLLTGAKPTPQMVPEFLSGRPLQFQTTWQRQTRDTSHNSNSRSHQLPCLGISSYEQKIISTTTDSTPGRYDIIDVR